MKILLDTQIALWIWLQPERLPDFHRKAIIDTGNEVYFSQVSTWEIQIKFTLGKLPLPANPEKFLPDAIDRSGFRYLPIQDDAIFFLARLPPLHRDPFDRLLVAHSITGNLHLATLDEQIRQYPVLLLS